MWRHFRVLGKVRDSVKEAELASRLFGLFKKEMGSAGRFFKQDHGVDVEVSEKLAADSKFFFFCMTTSAPRYSFIYWQTNNNLYSPYYPTY